MSYARARLPWAAAIALAAGAGLWLLRSGSRDQVRRPHAPKPDRLDRRGLAVLAVLALCVVACVAAPLFVKAREAGARQEWAVAATGGNPANAPALMVRNGCAGCHVISGVPGAAGRTGPELAGLDRQKFIAGTVPNNPENLVRWIREARRFDPHTAMPSTLVSEADARDMAAYLYAIRR